MKNITRKDPVSGEEISINYGDYGSGRPVVLIHGWPLSKEMWEYQLGDLVDAGFRVIKYDRRGFGKSAKPWGPYDYDTLAADLHALLEELNLEGATLVGFSMGGGEAVRYLSTYGNNRVAKLVLISSVTPFLLQTDDNPDGVPGSVFDEMLEGIRKDRIGFLDDFGKKFFGVTMLHHPVSTALLEYYRMLASLASTRSTQQCAIAFSQTDFRKDLEAVKVPTLIIHGDEDKTVPIAASSERSAKLIAGSEFKVYPGAPHGLFYTHKEELNSDLIDFISKG